MVDITVTKRYRGKSYKDERAQFQFGSKITVYVSGEAWIPPEPVPTVPVPDLVIEFSETNAPTVSDYNTLYQPTYGRYPKLMLVVYDEDYNELESIAKPIRTVLENALTTITWDLPEVCSGKIIISK